MPYQKRLFFLLLWCLTLFFFLFSTSLYLEFLGISDCLGIIRFFRSATSFSALHAIVPDKSIIIASEYKSNLLNFILVKFNYQ